jgi:hypothetical protein
VRSGNEKSRAKIFGGLKVGRKGEVEESLKLLPYEYKCLKFLKFWFQLDATPTSTRLIFSFLSFVLFVSALRCCLSMNRHGTEGEDRII